MNFLAHIYLSGENQELLVGNFIGDFVKGSQMSHFSDKIQKGIRLHRSIDFYTDSHPVVLQSKVRLREKFRHYAPVIVDIYYDHFLAKHWSNFSKTPLLQYTENFYQSIQTYADILPKGVTNMLTYMTRDNWLYNYQFLQGINSALTGMSRRTKFESKMEEASEALKEHYDDYAKEFFLFFPDLQTHVANFEK